MSKRLLITTLLGIVFGFVCLNFARSGGNEISTALALNIVSGRMLIGIAIGISRFPMRHWAIHGTVMGLIFGLPAGFGALLAPENPEFSRTAMMLSTLVMGMVYGFLIEFITTVLFRAKQ